MPSSPGQMRRDLSRHWSSFPPAARPFVSNLIQQLEAVEKGTGNPETLPALMATQLARIEAACRAS